MGGKLSVNLLLKANFFRLWRSVSFWATLAVMAAVSLLELALTAGAVRQGVPVPLENRYGIFVLVSSVVLSAFCSLYVGAEYSDGAVRNKLTVGHSRAAVYLANLMVCAAAGVLACLAYILPMLAFGIPIMGMFTIPLASILWFTLCGFIMTGAMCALYTMIAMLNQNKAVVAVICIFAAYFLLFLGIYMNSRLAEPLMIPAREYVENGQIVVQEAMPNAGYVPGAKRKVFEILYDLPGCQAVELLSEMKACPVRLPLVSLLAAAFSTAAGMAVFRKKDLK